MVLVVFKQMKWPARVVGAGQIGNVREAPTLSVERLEDVAMAQSSTETSVISRSVTVRIGLLLLLISAGFLLAGCANMNSDDRATFYSGWANPNGRPVTQMPPE